MRFSIHLPVDFVEPTEDDNVDVRIELQDGRTFGLTFFTVNNLMTLMSRWGKTGECADGLYVWAKNMVVIQTISRAVIERVVGDLIESGEIEHIGKLP